MYLKYSIYIVFDTKQIQVLVFELFSFPNIFNPVLAESTDVEPMGYERLTVIAF